MGIIKQLPMFTDFNFCYRIPHESEVKMNKENIGLINKQQRTAFSLVELLMALLVASLLMAALAPVITRKFADNIGITGISAKSDSNTIVKIFNEDGTFEVPAGILNLKVTMIGGGGAGGNAFYGTEEFTNSSYWTVPENVTKLRVFMVGGGGGGASGNLSQVTAFGSFSDKNETVKDFTEGETEYTLPAGAKIPALDEGCKNAGLSKWKLTSGTSDDYTPGAYMLKVTACGGGGGSSGHWSLKSNSGGGGSGGYAVDEIFSVPQSKIFIKVGGGGGGQFQKGGYAAGGGGGWYYNNGSQNQAGAAGGTFGGNGGNYLQASNGTAGNGGNGSGTLKSYGGYGGSRTDSSSNINNFGGNGGRGSIWGGGGGGGGIGPAGINTGFGGGGGGGPTTISSAKGTAGTIYFQVGGGGGGGGSAQASGSAPGGGGGGGGGGYAGGGGGGGGGLYVKNTASNGGMAGTGLANLYGSVSSGIKGGDGVISTNYIMHGGVGGGAFGGSSGKITNVPNSTDVNINSSGVIATIFGNEYCNGGSMSDATAKVNCGKPGKLRLYWGGTDIFKCTYNPIPNGGGGGSAGQITITEINVTPGNRLYFEIGNGGDAQNTRGKAGNPGKASYIRLNSPSGTILAQALGGNPGNHSTVAASVSTGGAAQALNLVKNWTEKNNFIASAGTNSILTTAASNKGYGGAGGASYNKDGAKLSGGAGGNSSKNGTSPVATSYGAGGGGGAGATSTNDTIFGTGGAGAGGYIYIEYGGSSGGGGTAGEFLTKTIVPPSNSVDVIVGKGGNTETGDGTGGISIFGTSRARGGAKGNDGGMDKNAHGDIKKISEIFVNKNFAEASGQAGHDNYGGIGGYMRYIYQADGGIPVTSITSSDGTIIGPVIPGCGGKMTFSMSSSLFGTTCNESGTNTAAHEGKNGLFGAGGGGGSVYNNLGGKGGRGGDGVVIIEYKLNPLPEEDG